MTRAVAIGSELRLSGYALAGVQVIDAGDAESVARTLEELPEDVALVILGSDPDARALAALGRWPGTVWCSLPT